MGRLSLDGVWEGHKGDPESGGDDWRPIRVPGHWFLDGWGDGTGIVWYRRHFELPEFRPDREDCWLIFEGADYFADVHVNGRAAGAHEGYFQPFEFLVTGLVHPGDNTLLVRVEAPREAAADWPHHKRWIKGVLGQWDCRPGAWHPERGQDGGSGGIWGTVALERTPKVSVRRVEVEPVLYRPHEGIALVRATLVNTLAGAGDVEIAAEVTGPGGQCFRVSRQQLLPPGGGTVALVVPVNRPRRWWPWDWGEQPLYTARVSVRSGSAEHRREARFAFRTVAIDDQGRWRVNGEPWFIRGTNLVPTLWLASYTEEAAARDVALAREAGFNAFRVSAFVNREAFYHACDEAGFLVWQEPPLQWDYDQSPDVVASAVRQTAEMVRTLFNHPSIAVWCLQNEPIRGQERLGAALSTLAGALDSSRPVIASADMGHHPYPGWYEGNLYEFKQVPGGPVVTEFGAQGLPSAPVLRRMLGEAAWPPVWEEWAYHDFQPGPAFHVAGLAPASSLEEFVVASQDYQARLLKLAVESYRRAKGDRIAGFFQFMFADPWPAITWSLLDVERTPKKAYDVLKQVCQPVMVSLPGDAAAGGQYFIDQDGFVVTVHLVNDYRRPLGDVTVTAAVADGCEHILESRSATLPVAAGFAGVAARLRLHAPPGPETRVLILLRAVDAEGRELAGNRYEVTLARLGGAERYAFPG